MLSNTATPKYYAEFRQKVLDGEIPVCETIDMEMNRIDHLIRDPKYYFDDRKVEGWIRFCEDELTLTDGSDVHMLDSFKLWGEELYGWYHFEKRQVYVPGKNGQKGRYVYRNLKRRLINKQFLITARGSAKTMYDHFVQSYGLVVDTSTTHGVTLAPTMRQAEEIITPFKTAIARSKGPLFRFLTEGSIQNTTGSRANRPKLTSTKKGIENFLTNSLLEIRPMTIDKVQGLQNKYSSVDEWLSGDIREDVIGSLEQGASKVDDYIILASSSEGTVRNGPGDSIKLELMDILKGEYYNPHVSIWWYKLDDAKEVAYPDLWIKANPNIGKTVKYSVYQSDVERAEKVPSARNDILAKRFGVPCEGYTYFFPYHETLPCKRKREYWKMPCSLGADLSQGDDFCAFTFAFPLAPERFGVKTRAYITERTYYGLARAMREKYDEFIKEDTLVVMPGSILRIKDVYDDLDEFIMEKNYNVISFGYDPYNAKEFVDMWITDNSDYAVEPVIQGSKTESVPLGELKKISEDGGLLFDEKLMSFAMGNCIVLEDTNGNRKLSKLRRSDKIDSFSALLCAYISYKRNITEFE